MPAVKQVKDLRAALLDAAGQLLAEEGAHAVSTRRLALEVGTSTQAIYTLYGGKEGIIRAMYREGFARLAAHMNAVPATSDPVADLRGLGVAYRNAALESPNLYEVMFGRPVAQFECSAEDRAFSFSTFETLAAGVQRALDRGVVAGADAFTHISLHCWVASHGFVSLELAGYLSNPSAERDATYERVLFGVIALFEATPGTTAKRAKLFA